MTAAVREVFATKPGEFDPRKYLAWPATRWSSTHKIVQRARFKRQGLIRATHSTDRYGVGLRHPEADAPCFTRHSLSAIFFYFYYPLHVR